MILDLSNCGGCYVVTITITMSASIYITILYQYILTRDELNTVNEEN